ncbi:flavin reductase [Bradyrhizobium sp. 14AA]
MAVDRVAFRDMMSRFGVAVSVVTTDGAAGQCGFTCTAVCSVTDEPPTVLVCLNRKSQMNAVFRRNGVLCVNVLSAAQEELSVAFAGRRDINMTERFTVYPWDRIATGAPALRNALGAFDCEISETQDYGTHTIFFGRVVAIALNPARDSLLYINREYRVVPFMPPAAVVGQS